MDRSIDGREFSKRFRLVARAIERAEQRPIKSSAIAKALKWSTSMQSSVENGHKSFPSEKLATLMAFIDPGRKLGRDLHDRTIWSTPFDTFATAVFNTEFVTERECGFPTLPLSARLQKSATCAEMLEVLRDLRTTHDDMNRFDISISRLRATSSGECARVETLLHEVIHSHWDTPGDVEIVVRAAEVLSRMASRGYTREAFRFPSHARSHLPARAWLTVEHCLSFVSMSHGEEEKFVGIVQRMADDVDWRKQDFVHHKLYYGNVVRMGLRTATLLATRHEHLRASELARAISCYEHLVLVPGEVDLAMALKEGALHSLRGVGLRRLGSRVESLMKRR